MNKKNTRKFKALTLGTLTSVALTGGVFVSFISCTPNSDRKPIIEYTYSQPVKLFSNSDLSLVEANYKTNENGDPVY